MTHVPGYDIKAATTDDHLRQIVSLQAVNLTGILDPEERRSQGFVTLRHDVALLREMNTPWGHLIATCSGTETVVAYALVMLPTMRARVPKLEAMFERLDRLVYDGRALTSYRHYVMGQICVAKEHRGCGLVERLYEGHRTQMSPHFDLLVTEIDRANTRSMRAHERAGFRVIDEYRAPTGADWAVVVLDWRSG